MAGKSGSFEFIVIATTMTMTDDDDEGQKMKDCWMLDVGWILLDLCWILSSSWLWLWGGRGHSVRAGLAVVHDFLVQPQIWIFFTIPT